ncbi:MAG: zinc dependent phospholipase C family protein [Nitrospirota bacterium]
MKIFKLLLIISFLSISTPAFAWGPLTHIYLGNEVYYMGSLLPAALFEIIRRYRKDFLYGNLVADIIFGKKYLPEDKNSHSWEVAFDLLNAAETKQQKAFVYGYMSHLAADTVAHNSYIVNKKNIRHTVLEIKADSIINKKYWFQAMTFDKKIQMRNDLFLENFLERFVFSFKTNKRILKSTIFFSILYREKINDFIDKNLITTLPPRKTIESLQEKSLDRIVDLFQNWERSNVVKLNPCGNGYKNRFFARESEPDLFRIYKK